LAEERKCTVACHTLGRSDGNSRKLQSACVDNMKPGKRSSLLNAITMPLSILLYWQALGWLAFGVLKPGISQSLGSPVDSRLILTIGIVLAIATTSLGSFFLYYHVTTLQRDIFPQHKTLHKCLNCGHPISDGISTCPYCGSRTLFYVLGWRGDWCGLGDLISRAAHIAASWVV